MKELEVIVPPNGSMLSAATIDAVLKRSGLHVTLRSTLAGYPGCTHWHVKKGRERGVLELTHWPAGGRVWFSMQDGRQGDWVMQAAQELKKMLESKATQ